MRECAYVHVNWPKWLLTRQLSYFTKHMKVTYLFPSQLCEFVMTEII
jgi:hypothetical protein